MTRAADRATVAAMPGNTALAEAVAGRLGVASASVDVRAFPDGESLVRVPPAGAATILFCTLDRPDEKLVRLLLAAGAFRDRGVGRLVLVAPYLCYMRQDKAFRDGEAVSQRIVGYLLAQAFDRVVAVEPHLHRTPDLGAVLPGIEADALPAAPVVAEMARAAGAELLVGPDAESGPWVAAVAERLGLPWIVATKQRSGDRDVRVTLADAGKAAGRRAVMVDDVVSSGGTLAACARALVEAGAAHVEAAVAHALCSDADLAALEAAGVARLRSTDSVVHPTNAATLAPLLAEALAREVRG